MQLLNNFELLTYKLHLLSAVIHSIKLSLANEISGMLQFYLIFDSQDCYWIECPEKIFKKLLLNATNYLYNNS